MKKLLLCLALVALMAAPAMAQYTCPTFGDGNVGIDVQGYVDGTASYQAGCVEQESCEVGIKEVCDVSTAGKVTDFDCEANVPSNSFFGCNNNSCGVDVDQTSWDMSLTFTKTCSVFKEEVQGKYAVGTAAMNSLGGVAICATETNALNAAASVYNNHNIQNTATVQSGFCWGPSCTATASYQGSQTLDLSANYSP